MNSPAETSKPYSCVICHNRKVKCDRQEPCSNCAKANAECVYRPPPPPRRRKRERADSVDASQDGKNSIRRAHHELTRNEDYMKTSGTELGTNRSQRGPGPGRMIVKEGNSIFLDSILWKSVSQELPDASHVLHDNPENDSENFSQEENDETLIILSPGSGKSSVELHPNPLHLFKLWQTFLENVNPLIKLLHTPTIQPRILEAMGDLQKTDKELEALMFSIYCISLISLTNDEAEKSFGESKKKLLQRFRKGARIAFGNASLLRTSSFMVLQAFILYILSMRAFSDPPTTWTLSGVAMRIAQRIGIHREGSGYGLSPFDTEMRRRVWFQLQILDATSAQSCGVAANPMLPTSDSRPPVNVNDSDLDPLMQDPPQEKDGATEMMFCLARSEFGKWLHRWRASDGSVPSSSPWASLAASSMSLKEKDDAINELENLLEEKYLKYCDPSIPLHTATIMMARSAVLYTRLVAHHPRHYQETNTRMPHVERDLIFQNCLKMADYANYVQTHGPVQRFSWHTVNHMPWDAMIFLLTELRNRSDPTEKEKVWEVVTNIYSRHLGQRHKNAEAPLQLALQNLIAKAWRSYVEECNASQRLPVSCPPVVLSILEKSKDRNRVTLPSGHPQPEDTDIPDSRQDPVTPQFTSEGTELDFIFNEDSPMDWNEWDNLLNQFHESLMDDMLMPETIS